MDLRFRCIEEMKIDELMLLFVDINSYEFDGGYESGGVQSEGVLRFWFCFVLASSFSWCLIDIC